MLYFAYGSNLNLRDMKRRAPRAKPLCAATLADHRLVFRGFADLQKEKGAVVHGALYELTPACVRALDTYEGDDYKKITVKVETAEGVREAMAYIMHGGDIAPPGLQHFTAIAKGYGDWKLDTNILQRARFATLHPKR